MKFWITIADTPAAVRLAAGCVLVWIMFGTTGCRALRKDPISQDVIRARQMSLRGLDAIQRGQAENAEVWFANACQTNPTDERAHVQYAELLWQRGAQPQAIEHAEQSVKLSGGDPALRVRLGEMYLARGDLERAWQQAQEARKSNQHLACVWALIGDIHRQQGALPEAVAAYHRSLSYEAHCSHVQLALAGIYQTQNRPRRALSTLESLAENYPPDATPVDLLVAQGLALKALGRYGEAIEQFSLALDRGEPSAELFYQLAEAQMLAGDNTNARLAVTAALAEQPNHAASRGLQNQLDQQRQPLTAALGRF